MAINRPQQQQDADKQLELQAQALQENKQQNRKSMLQLLPDAPKPTRDVIATTNDKELTNEEVDHRISELWITISILGAVMGGTAFEGLWLRPQPASGVEDGTPPVMRQYAACMYVSIMLNTYAVLVSVMLFIINLFYTESESAKRMLYRYSFAAGAPAVFLITGTTSFSFLHSCFFAFF